ncbi:hypothetical protein BBN39_003719 [Salmonella enterica subsp. diarizonae serovar 53:z10:z]|nr:hypothetical protein [Salmonella enterica subsp. diarizonae]EDU6310730.1 hypothetical protein [Salmonella enterica subsp. diarizonae serovar 53:z10:z]
MKPTLKICSLRPLSAKSLAGPAGALTEIWQPEFTDKTLSRKTGAVQTVASFS